MIAAASSSQPFDLLIITMMSIDPSPARRSPGPLDVQPLKGKRGWPRIIAACGYSFDGLAAAWRHENAFRQEVILTALLVPVAVVLPFPIVERVLLIGVLLLVLIVELVNSAIEAAVDRGGLQIDPLAKRAKDSGSAAVMLALTMAGGTWLAILASHFL